jgi:hypothetical protein
VQLAGVTLSSLVQAPGGVKTRALVWSSIVML